MTAPGLRFGRYEVGDRIGRGSFGVVHFARDVELGRELAIKFLRPEYQIRPMVVQRFLQEARAAARIGHPGIVTVFECGQIAGTGLRADGTAFIAMELLKGQNLADRLLDACNLRNAAKSKSYWKRISPAMRTPVSNICVRNGITEEDLNAP